MTERLPDRFKAFAATAAIVGLLLIWTGVQVGTGHVEGVGLHEPLAWVVFFAACVVIFFRRRFPVGTLIAVAVLSFAYYPLSGVDSPEMLLFLLGLYTVASVGRIRLAVIVAGVAFSAMMLPQLTAGFRWVTEAEALLLSGWYAASVAIGAVVHQYRALRVESENAVDQARRRSVAEERLRIARELHDAVGHHLSLINVQTVAALRRLKKNPEYETAGTLKIVSETSQLSLRELRAMVGVLRDAGEDSPTGPGPTLGELPKLAAAARAAGLEVDLRRDGMAELPVAVDAAAYRVVQEALTNVLRHAEASRVWIKAVTGTSTLAVSVVDDGVGAPKGGKFMPGKFTSQQASTWGNGLTGMRERAESLGGTFEAGPREDGGFFVEATWPLEVQS